MDHDLLRRTWADGRFRVWRIGLEGIRSNTEFSLALGSLWHAMSGSISNNDQSWVGWRIWFVFLSHFRQRKGTERFLNNFIIF